MPFSTRISSSRLAQPFDLRLAMLAAGVWGGSLAAVRLSAPWAFGLAALAAATAMVAWRRRGGSWLAVATVAVGAFGGAASTATHVAVAEAEPLPQWAEAGIHVTATVTLDNDPRPPRDSTQTSLWAPATLEEAAYEGRSHSFDARIVVVAAGETAAAWEGLLPGQRLEIEARVAPADDRAGLTAALLSVRGEPELIGEPGWWQRGAGALRDGLAEASQGLSDAAGGLLLGMSIGDTRQLPLDVEADFQTTGMTHLTAVSGYHMGIVAGTAMLVAAALRAGPRTRMAVGLAVIAAFVVLVRPGPSVMRAAVMGAVGLLAIVSGRPSNALPSLSGAVIVLVLLDPDLTNRPGFALSVSATLALVFFVTSWSRRMEARGWPRWLAVVLAVAVAAQLAVTPQLATMTGEVSLVAILANVAATPAAAPVIVLGVAAAVVSAVSAPAAAWLAWLASWPATYLAGVARHGARLPGGVLPWPDTAAWAVVLALLLGVALLACRSKLGRRILAVAVLGIVVGIVPMQLWHGGWPPRHWAMVACDVGQGDALVIPAGVAGSAIVIDAGPTPEPVDQCLRRLGVDHVPLLAVSHYHADHVGGISGVYSGRRVDAVLGPHDKEPEAGHRQVSEELAQAPPSHGGLPTDDPAAESDVLTPPAGTKLEVGEVLVEVLAAGDDFNGTRSDPNNNSLVLRITVEEVTILATGDIETEAQEALLTSGADLDVDVLKVPHHGSAYSASEFFDAVSPTVAVVSAGQDNDYGHPHATVLRHLQRQGSTLLRTDRDGDVAVVAAGGRVEVASVGADS